MEESTSKVEDSTDGQLIEDICQIKWIALGEGAVVCQVCGSSLSDGSAVTVFVYRPAGQPTFEVGHVICGENDHDLPTYFTLGVRELIVDGHIGRCVDVASDASWPILLEPSVRAVSLMSSTSGRIAPESSTDSSGEVSWVYGDALLDRATDVEPDGVPGDGSPPTDHDGTVIADDTTDVTPPGAGDEMVNADDDSDGAAPPADTECSPGSRDDTVPADADSPPAAGTGPAGSDSAVPADADGPPTNDSTVETDETNGEGGEC
ncbi:hypothetical protein [Halohasta litorea]|uniref:DUF8112 domain-containing protein n=1 Tax=Halohasta litorea TaxID=869891 RepID=A0ABD6D8Y6_9EURY|nr:hypothetical protein [Halohasta litorea]